MPDFIFNATFQWIASILITAAISVYLSLRFSTRKKIFFEIGNVFHLTNDNNLNHFEKLEVLIDGKNILDKSNEEVVFVEFDFINTGNRDIRFTKKDGQFLRFSVDEGFDILDVRDKGLTHVDYKKNSVDVILKSLKMKAEISIGVLLRYKSDGGTLSEDEIRSEIMSDIRFQHDIQDVKKISTERRDDVIAGWVFISFFSSFFLWVSINLIPGNEHNQVGPLADFIIGVVTLGIALIIIFSFVLYKLKKKKLYSRQNPK